MNAISAPELGRGLSIDTFEPSTPERSSSPSQRRCATGDTNYDELLMSGVDRAEARSLVRDEVERVLESWRAPSG